MAHMVAAVVVCWTQMDFAVGLMHHTCLARGWMRKVDFICVEAIGHASMC